MSKPEWGIKRICQSCSAKFYDMRKDPIVCPSCGTTFDPDIAQRTRRPRSAPAGKAPKANPVVTEELETETEAEDDADGQVADGDDDNLLVADDELDDGDEALPGIAASEGDEDS